MDNTIYEDTGVSLADFTAQGGVSITYTAAADSLRVRTTSNGTYKHAYKNLTTGTIEANYAYRIDVNLTRSYGDATVYINDAVTSKAIFRINVYTTGTSKIHAIADGVPSNTSSWSSSSTDYSIRTCATWSTRKSGDITFDHLKFIKYRPPKNKKDTYIMRRIPAV